MFQNNPLLSQLKQELSEQVLRVEGTVRAHAKGFGFLDVDSKTSYFIPIAKMKKVCNGDKVSGMVISQHDKQAFEPENLIRSSLQTFIGKVAFKDKSMIVYPDNVTPAFPIRCKVAKEVNERLKEGDCVVASLISHPLEEGKNTFFAEIGQFIAEASSPYKLWLKTLVRYDLETVSPESEPLTIDEQETQGREDLTNENFFTIDSENTQDMDDAITISKDAEGNYQLLIAIADPTAYVLPESKLDHIAKIRNFTTYLPDFNVPMLPKELANELCSLKADQKRPAMVCRVTIDKEGNLAKDACFSAAWIESKAKLSYYNVSDFLEKGSELSVNNETLPEQLKRLSELATIRLNWRKSNALVYKDNSDYRFILNEMRQVKAIVKDSRRVAHYMVEEVMIIANQALTSMLKERIGFGIFNIHSGFDKKYVDQIIKLLNKNQINDFDKESITTFDGYVKLRRMIDDDESLSFRLRRFQNPADFSTKPSPHYGLGFDAYATWTSPIRKYGDMLNHRLIKAFIRKQQLHEPEQSQLKLMNDRRKMLRFAERDIADALYMQYLSNKIGDSYEAEIIEINRGGAKVRLTEIGAAAFLPLSMVHLVRDEISSQPEEGCIEIKGERVYQIADKITIIIHDVNQDSKSVIAKLASAAS